MGDPRHRSRRRTSAGRTRTRRRIRPAAGPPTPAAAGERVINSRTGSAARTGHSSVDSAKPIRSATGREVSRSAATAVRIRFAYWCRGRRAIRSSSSAPPSRSLAISSPDCPAAALASTACRQVPSGSLQASTTKVHMPMPVGDHLGAEQVGPVSPRRHPQQRPGLLGGGPSLAGRSFRGGWGRGAPDHIGGHGVVPLAKHRGRHVDDLSDDGLGGITAAGNRWPDVR